MQSWLFLGGAIICEVMATSALKASDGFTRVWPSVVVVLGYMGTFYLLSFTKNNSNWHRLCSLVWGWTGPDQLDWLVFP